MNNEKNFNKKGDYGGYNKNHAERAKEDYYSTPTEEVTNILSILNLNLEGKSILEPSYGGGHMIDGILKYNDNCFITGIELEDKGYQNDSVTLFPDADFFETTIEPEKFDFIIMNPPFKIVEKFVSRCIDLKPKEGILVLARLQFLESVKRYEKVFAQNPPTDVYVYVDRIKCYKNGDPSIPVGNAQAYAWFFWDCNKKEKNTEVHWIRRFL